jgi:hypothetical protein
MANPETPFRPVPEPEPRMGIEAFGVVKVGDRWKPVLERYEGPDACKKCSGFGTYGNPLCGAVYTCTECHGEGRVEPLPPWYMRLWTSFTSIFAYKKRG